MLLSGFLLIVAGLATHVPTVQAQKYEMDCFEQNKAAENCAESEESCPVSPQSCQCGAGFQLNPTASGCELMPRPSFDMQGNRLELPENQDFGDSLKKKIESISRDANELKNYLTSRYDEFNNAKKDPCHPSNRDRKNCHSHRGHKKKFNKKMSKPGPAAIEIRVFVDGAHSGEVRAKKIGKLPKHLFGTPPHHVDMKIMKNPLIPMPPMMFVPNIPPEYFQNLGMPFPPLPLMAPCANVDCSNGKAANGTTNSSTPTSKSVSTDSATTADSKPSPQLRTTPPRAAREGVPVEPVNARRYDYGHNYYPIRDTYPQPRDRERMERRMDNMPRDRYIDNMPRDRYSDNMPRDRYIDNMPRDRYIDNMQSGRMHKNIEPFYPDHFDGNEDYANKFNADVRSLQNRNIDWPERDIAGLSSNLRVRSQDENAQEKRAIMHRNLINVNNYGDYVSVWPKQLKDEKDHAVDNVGLPSTFNRIRSRSQPPFYEENFEDILNDNNLDDQIRSLVRKVYFQGKGQKFSLGNKKITDINRKVMEAYSPSLINVESIKALIKELSESKIEVLNDPALTNKTMISQDKILAPHELNINETSTQSVHSKIPYVSSFVYKILKPESSVDGMNATHRIEYTIKDENFMKTPAKGQHDDPNTLNDEIMHQIELEVLGQNQSAIGNSVLNLNNSNMTFTHMNNVDNEKHIKDNSHGTLIKANLENSNNEKGNISKNLDDTIDIIAMIEKHEKEKVESSLTDMIPTDIIPTDNKSNIEAHSDTVTSKSLSTGLDLKSTKNKVTYILNPSHLSQYG